jgi:multidrug efflux system membrane fusion protein
MSRVRWIIPAALLLGAGWWALGTEQGRGILRKPAQGTAQAVPGAAAGRGQQRPPAPVSIAKVVSEAVPLRLEGIGTVQARNTIAVKSRIDGQLLQIHVKEGQSVKRDDLLFTIDPRPLQALLLQAEANNARDKANLEKARGDFERAESLVGKGVSPKSKREETLALLKALEATVAASEAAIQVARLNLGYSSIKAPIDGRIGNLLVHAGNMIKANDAQALVVINEIDPVNVAFAVPERYLDDIRRRMAATKITVQAWAPNERQNAAIGELFFMNNAIDVTTGTITLMAQFPNADQKLMPGQFVHASASVGALAGALLVPSQAVQIGQRGNFVFVVKEDKTVEIRPITLGPTVDGRTVIEKGLKAGETVVTNGQMRLFPGATVVPQSDRPAGQKPKEQS